MISSVQTRTVDEQMSMFTASDVLQFAIRMEEDAELFYRTASVQAEKKEVKKLFNTLALEEADHKKTFEGLLSKVADAEPAEEYPGEYLAYLHNYIDGKIFVALDAKAARFESRDVATALESAIQRKMACIHYYQELKAFVPVDDHPTVDRVINEERKHFVRMSAERKKHK